MAFEHREGGGALFHRKKGNDFQPDLEGKLLVGGVLYELAGWIKASKQAGGNDWLSLKATPAREAEAQAQPPPPIDDDTVPF